MRKLFTLLAAAGLSSFAHTGNAQENFSGKVSGSVTGNQLAIESATVNLLNAVDSSVAKIVLSDKIGQFELANWQMENIW